MWLKTLRLSHNFVVLFILAAGSIWSVMSVHAAPPAVASASDHNYHISGDAILCDGKPIIMRGINAMNIYAPKDDPFVFTWPGINIIREFVGDLKNNPLQPGEIFRGPNNHSFHSLQDVVNRKRKAGLVTIVCPFAWDGSKATEFTGCSPQGSSWYAEYKLRMRDWAKQFKGQSDVWIEVMNEPFHPLSGVEGDEQWLATMGDMVDNLRSAGWDGIILVPGSAWGGDETVIERQGAKLVKGRRDLLFDVHVYDSWLEKPELLASRCERVKKSGLPFIFAEVGPGTHHQQVIDARPFLKAAENNHFSVLAWGWGTWGQRDPLCLQTNDGGPNNVGNCGWGTAFKAFLATTCFFESSHRNQFVEAENCIESNNCHALKAEHPFPFSGTGAVGFDAAPSSLQWAVNVPLAGFHHVSLKYCNFENHEQTAQLSVNGAEQKQIKFVSTTVPRTPTPLNWYAEASKDCWRFAVVPVYLQTGRNVINLATQSHSEQLIIDNLSVTPNMIPSPVLPIFDVKSFGAKGDGSTLDTAALQKAIDSCAGTGGTVLLKGGAFLSGPIQLKSDMTLWIDDGASLCASTQSNLYPIDQPPGQLENDDRHPTFVRADGVSNLFITGGGIIDGNGDADVWSKIEQQQGQRPMLMRLSEAKNIGISNLEIRNAAFWTVMLNRCERVIVDGINVESGNRHNTDGIDVCDSQIVTIFNSSFLTDDDAICPKSYSHKGLRYLYVKNASLASSASAMKFGTASYGGFNDCHFEDITVARSGSGISLGIADGATLSDANFLNIRMGNVFLPINVLQGAALRSNWKMAEAPKKPSEAGHVGNILFENISAYPRKQYASFISGVEQAGATYRVENVTLRHVNVENQLGYNGDGNDPPEYSGGYPDYGWMGFKHLPAHGLYVRHAKNVKLEDCHFTSKADDSRPDVVLRDVIP